MVFCRIVAPITRIQTLNELPWLELIIGHHDSSPRNENQGAYHVEYNSNRGSNLQVTRQPISIILFLYHVFSWYLAPEWFIVNLIIIRTSISYLRYYHYSINFNPPPHQMGSCGLFIHIHQGFFVGREYREFLECHSFATNVIIHAWDQIPQPFDVPVCRLHVFNIKGILGRTIVQNIR